MLSPPARSGRYLPFLLSSLLSAFDCVCVNSYVLSLGTRFPLGRGAVAGRVGSMGQGWSLGALRALLPPSLAGFHRAESH